MKRKTPSSSTSQTEDSSEISDCKSKTSEYCPTESEHGANEVHGAKPGTSKPFKALEVENFSDEHQYRYEYTGSNDGEFKQKV